MKKIAVIGSGVSGMVCARLLSTQHNVHLFEKRDRLGGHTATKEVEYQGQTYQVDTGFIVYNDRTYPNFIKLMDKLGIQGKATEMSFSVHNKDTGLEYNGHDLNTLFAQRRNLVRPKFWRLIREIVRFNKTAKQRFADDDFSANETLGSFLDEQNFSEFFAEHYILPMGAAIWSTSLQKMKEFELKFFVRFFYHHGLLNISDRPQWYVIPGGSKQYIAPLLSGLEANIHLDADIKKVTRENGRVQLHFADTVSEFDEVVLACHSDQALNLLGDASAEESSVLSAIPYSKNSVILHTDTDLLPKRRLAWAAWNYLLDNNESRPAAVTYNMNILQGIEAPCTFCVTLNQPIDEDKVIGQYQYAHPVFNTQSMAAQQRRKEICGLQHTHFAGAYWYNGFHEDGVRSAVDVAARFGISLDDL
ncbi:MULTISPECIES: FAD-dependent oxidoreductase [unclassified Pseudoalteromonas]|uniref:NAD(P)/FAD-dependent oxidoreductase n=1 Tax=unclassified Pseudoalteromonas TaxID=194690 RepID=UPI00209698D7|nr:FAD-dependent oxidoreductase [Pseudoalteromonas sp. XMcav2-N]MCO7187837.1 FAD-dependent oxidoreductase [Pseudoalteromonas sp. XMcav2-N]